MGKRQGTNDDDDGEAVAAAGRVTQLDVHDITFFSYKFPFFDVYICVNVL